MKITETTTKTRVFNVELTERDLQVVEQALYLVRWRTPIGGAPIMDEAGQLQSELISYAGDKDIPLLSSNGTPVEVFGDDDK